MDLCSEKQLPFSVRRGGAKRRGGSKAILLKVGGFGTTPRGIRFAIPLPS